MLITLLTALALAGAPNLELQVAPVPVPAVVEVPLDTLLWVDIHHPKGRVEAVAEILGDDLSNCDDLRSTMGFRPRNADALWDAGLLRYAVVEVTSKGIRVAGRQVMPLEDGRTPDRFKRGVVLTPLLDELLAQHEAQFQFQGACKDPDWTPNGPATAGSSARLLVAVAADVPFDIVNEVLLTARKARFRTFYLYASSRRVAADPHALPPSLGDTQQRVFVASDGGLGIDPEEEGQDSATALMGYLPRPAATRSARIVPYPASPFGAVVSSAGALLAMGWEPSVIPRLAAPDLRSSRKGPAAAPSASSLSSRRPVQAVPVTLPEGSASEPVSQARRTRFSITGSTDHVAIFTPPAHLADALNTPDVSAQLKHLLTCYRDEEADTAGLEGEVALEIRVDPTGAVSKVAWLPTSTLDDPQLKTCVLDEFHKLRFPAAAITPEPMLWKVQLLTHAPGTPPPPARSE